MSLKVATTKARNLLAKRVMLAEHTRSANKMYVLKKSELTEHHLNSGGLVIVLHDADNTDNT